MVVTFKKLGAMKPTPPKTRVYNFRIRKCALGGIYIVYMYLYTVFTLKVRYGRDEMDGSIVFGEGKRLLRYGHVSYIQ